MSTSTEELRVKLLDARKAEKELRSVRKELEQTTGATSSHGRASRKAAHDHEHGMHVLRRSRTALEYGGGLLGLSAVGFGLKDLFQGGIRAQEQQVLLQQALRQTGQGGSAHMRELEKAITQTTSHGGFSALEESEGIAGFVRETKSSTQAVKLNKEAIALARGAHMDYGRSLQVVRRIQTGQVGRLQQYLGIIQPVKTYVEQLTTAEKKRYPQKVKEAELLDKEATAQEANRRVLERYGGAVKVYNESAAGSISNANNAFKRATDELGEKTLPVVTDVAKGFTEIITEAEAGKGIWGPLGHDIEATAGDLKEVWKWLEKNQGVAEVLGITLGGAFATEKILKFYEDLKKLRIIETITGGFGKLAPAAKAGAAELDAEEGAYAASGTLLGGAWAGAFAIAAGVGLGVLINKLFPNGIFGHKEHTVDEATQALAGARPGSHAFRIENGELKPNRSFPHTHLGGRAATGALSPEEARVVSAFLEHPHSATGLTDREVALIEKAFERAHMAPTNIYLDGKLLAQSVGHHIRHDMTVARPVAEGVTKYAQHRKARE